MQVNDQCPKCERPVTQADIEAKNYEPWTRIVGVDSSTIHGAIPWAHKKCPSGERAWT